MKKVCLILILFFTVYTGYALELTDSNSKQLHNMRINALKFSPNGEFLVSCSEKEVKVWFLKSDKVITMNEHTKDVCRTVILEDNNTIITAGNDNRLIRWDITRNDKEVLADGINPKSNISVSEDGKKVTIGFMDNSIKQIDLPTGRTDELTKSEEALWTMKRSPNGKYIAWGCDAKSSVVNVYDLENKTKKSMNKHSNGIFNLAFSSDSRFIATAGLDKSVKVWNHSENKVYSMNEHCGEVWDVGFSPNNKYVLSSSNDNTLKIWNYKKDIVNNLTVNKNTVVPISISNDGKYIATGDVKGFVKVYGVPTMDLGISSIIDKLAKAKITQEIQIGDEDEAYSSKLAGPSIEIIYSQVKNNRVSLKILVTGKSPIKGASLLIISKNPRGINFKPKSDTDKKLLIEHEIMLDEGTTKLVVVASTGTHISVSGINLTYIKDGNIIVKKDFTESKADEIKTYKKDGKTKALQGNVDKFYRKGREYLDNGKFDKAIEMFNKAIELDNQYFEAYVDLGYAYKRVEKLNKALQTALKGVEVSSSNDKYIQWGYFNVACYYSLLKNKEQALYYLKLAIKKDPALKSAALTDEDFNNIKDDKEFIQLVKDK